jgi:hypothetical protein
VQGAAGERRCRHAQVDFGRAIGRHACPVMSAAAQVVPGTLGIHAEVLGAVVLARQEGTPSRA